MASVRDIAEQAGVSITTVSRVLNNHPRVSSDARQRVLTVANQTRYVARVGRRSTSNIAFLYTGELSLGSPFDASLMQGMSMDMQSNGYDLLVLSAIRSRRSRETISQMLMRKGVRGAIVRTTTETRRVINELQAENFPFVVVADVSENPKVHCVDADSQVACRRAIEHLLHLGHRRIAITLNVVDDYDHAQRLHIYQQVLREAGLPIDEQLILRVPAFRDAGALALRQIMSMHDRPTAVFLTDPLAAVGLFHESQRTGVKIPEQLSVIGFDDNDVRFGVYPRMSSVCQNAELLGREAFAVLNQLMNQPNASPASPKLECWLELHESTANPTGK